MTTEGIAGRSGVSKATIYKWWSNKYALAVDAFLSELMAESPDPDTGSAHEDFRSLVRGLMHFYRGPSGRVFAQLIAEGQSDPLVQKELREHLTARRRELMQAIWHRGVARGECAPTSIPAQRSISWSARRYTDSCWGAPLDDAAADSIVDAAIRGFALGD